MPTGRVNLDVDYKNVQDNFQQLDTSFGVDHTLFSVDSSEQPAGYHESIHLIPQSNTTTNPPNNFPPVQPATTGGFSQIWSAQVNDGINIDEALYFLTGGGRSMQLTRNTSPIAASGGLSFIPGPADMGAILIQWGVSSIPPGIAGSVTFPLAFPNACFNVQITVDRGPSTGTGGVAYDGVFLNGAPSQTGFNTNSGYPINRDIYWVAMGY